MTATRTRKSTDPTYDMGYVEYHKQQPARPRWYPHTAIDLPAAGVVAMVDEVMLRIQRSIHPVVTWNREDRPFFHTTTLRWHLPQGQLQLSCYADVRGFGLRLHSTFGPWYKLLESSQIASWNVSRSTFDWDYGQLNVFRIGLTPEHQQLRFDHPLLEGIPRWKPSYESFSYLWTPERPELVTDVIDVIQGRIDAANNAA